MRDNTNSLETKNRQSDDRAREDEHKKAKNNENWKIQYWIPAKNFTHARCMHTRAQATRRLTRFSARQPPGSREEFKLLIYELEWRILIRCWRAHAFSNWTFAIRTICKWIGDSILVLSHSVSCSLSLFLSSYFSLCPVCLKVHTIYETGIYEKCTLS